MAEIKYVNSDKLYHYGHLGMRWGYHIFGRDKRGGKSKHKAKGKPAPELPEESISDKEKLIRKGNKKQILRNIDRLSDEELRRAMNRVDTRARLGDIQKNPKTKKEKVQDIINVIDTGSKAAGSAAKAWRTLYPYQGKGDSNDGDQSQNRNRNRNRNRR